MNDITIIMGVVFIFVGLGFIMPYIQEDFSNGTTNTDMVGLESELNEDYNTITIWGLLWSVLKMFVWTFGNFPLWVDALFFLPLRIMFFVTLARNIHIGGGS